MRAYLGLAAVVLGFGGLAQAGSLDLKQVSADAKWAAHLDVDALTASSMFPKVRDQILKEHPEAESKLALVRNLWRFDPYTDLHGITIYGTQLKKSTGVASYANTSIPFGEGAGNSRPQAKHAGRSRGTLRPQCGHGSRAGHARCAR